MNIIEKKIKFAVLAYIMIISSLQVLAQPPNSSKMKIKNYGQITTTKDTLYQGMDILSIEPGIGTKILTVYYDESKTKYKRTICTDILKEIGLDEFPKGTFNVPFVIKEKKRFFIFSPGANGLLLVSPTDDNERVQYNKVKLHDTLRNPIPFTMLPDGSFAFIDSTLLVEYMKDGKIHYYNVSALLNNTPDDISLEPFKNETDGEVIFVKINGKPVGGIARKSGDLLMVKNK